MDNVVRILIMLFLPIVTIGQQLDYYSTFISNGQKFEVQRIQMDKYLTLLKIRKGKDIILADTSEFSTELDILDFNGDGGLDIKINFMGNIDTQSLFILDKEKNEFKKVKDFEKFPAAKKLKGTNHYYSYRRSGCADNYWASDLFTIVDFKVIHLGQIFGEGCEEPTMVNIYKIEQGKKQLKETLSYQLVKDHQNDKWGFIDDYWTENYQKFK